MEPVNIVLQKMHDKQQEIVDACLDDEVFFIVAVTGRQVGKSTLGRNMALYWALSEKDVIVYWISPTDSQSQKVYKEIVGALIESGCIRSKKMPKGDTEIVFKNGSKILFRSAASEDSLRGSSVHYMILDEAAFIKKDTFEAILMPMLSVIGRKCLFLTTPKGKNYIYEYFTRGQLPEFKRWKSFRCSTYDSPLANLELIQDWKDTLPEKLFKQEVEAEFVDNAAIFNNITEVLCLQETIDPDPEEEYYAGLDIGLINDASVLAILDSNGNLVKYYRWLDIKSPVLIERIKEINDIWNFKNILIENNNQGLVIYQALENELSNIEEFNTNTKTKPELINKLIHLFNMKEIKLVKDEYLRIELEAFMFKQNSNGNIKFQADNGFNDDVVMALAIARYCYENRYIDTDYNFIFM